MRAILVAAVAVMTLAGCQGEFLGKDSGSNFWNVGDSGEIQPVSKAQEETAKEHIGLARGIAQLASQDLEGMTGFATSRSSNKVSQAIQSRCALRTRSLTHETKQWYDDRLTGEEAEACPVSLSIQETQHESRIAARSDNGRITTNSTNFKMSMDEAQLELLEDDVVELEFTFSSEIYSRAAQQHRPGIKTSKKNLSGTIIFKNGTETKFNYAYRKQWHTASVDDRSTKDHGKSIEFLSVETPQARVTEKEVYTKDKHGKVERKTSLNGKVQEDETNQ